MNKIFAISSSCSDDPFRFISRCDRWTKIDKRSLFIVNKRMIKVNFWLMWGTLKCISYYTDILTQPFWLFLCFNNENALCWNGFDSYLILKMRRNLHFFLYSIQVRNSIFIIWCMCSMAQFDTSTWYDIFARATSYWVCAFIPCKMRSRNMSQFFIE